MSDSNERITSPRLIVGIVLLPIVFAWFTLRTGYSKQVRLVSFSWLVLVILFTIINGGNAEQDDKSIAINTNTVESPKNKEAAQHIEKQRIKSENTDISKNPIIDYGNINNSSQNMPISIKDRINKSVYTPYDYNNNKQVFDIFGTQRTNAMQPIRQKLAEQAISSGKCTKVNMSEVSIDSDINNPEYFVWCYTEGANGKPGKEYQIYATESAIRSNAPLLGKDERGLSDNEATTICRRQVINNTKEFSSVKVHYIADQTFFKKTDGSSTVKIGVTITNDLGVKLPHMATCSFDENGNITYFDILHGARG